MPRETFEITLGELDPYRCGADFLGIVAYPDPQDEKQREGFTQSLARQTILRRIELDPTWAKDPQLIRPGYFSGTDALHSSVLKRGTKKLNQRLAVAKFIVIPHLRAIDTGRAARQAGLAATVENMSILAANYLGLEPGSAKTVQSRFWKPSKPIVHAMCAYVIWHESLWQKWGRSPGADKPLAFLFLPEMVEEVVQIAEEIRQQLFQITQFTIREQETIQLVTKWLPVPNIVLDYRGMTRL